MSTIDQFLSEINQILRAKDGLKLQDYLFLEPPLPPLYNVIVTELRQNYPSHKQDALELRCNKLLPEEEEGDSGGSWPAFVSFLLQYFAFLRDVNVDNLVDTHQMLKSLLNHCILALSDASMGKIVLSTVISFSRTLARLAIGLDKRPELIRHLTRSAVAGGEGIPEKVTLVESTANVIREAFKKSLSERSGNSSGLDEYGKPEGRRVGIYLCANLCLKLFFHCKKLRNCEQIFSNIYQQSPPLAKFPASQRVTYLYYLGRYMFANSHFRRSQLALQEAYNQCHRQAIQQRRSILIYLITSNIIMGRFPTSELLLRPEAEGLGERFLPICQAIGRGDLAAFRDFLDWDRPYTNWFLDKRILFQLKNRCDFTIWRSLARRTFMLSGFKGDFSKRAPSLDLRDLHVLGLFMDERTQRLRDSHKGDGVFRNGVAWDNPYLCSEEMPEDTRKLSMREVEGVAMALVNQGFLHGYLSHKYLRFVITGAKAKPALEIGFPSVWSVIEGKANKEVPGWVREGERGLAEFPTVVNISGARPVGASPSD